MLFCSAGFPVAVIRVWKKTVSKFTISYDEKMKLSISVAELLKTRVADGLSIVGKRGLLNIVSRLCSQDVYVDISQIQTGLPVALNR